MRVDLRMELCSYAGHRAKLSNLLKDADLLKIRDLEETCEFLVTSAASIVYNLGRDWGTATHDAQSGF